MRSKKTAIETKLRTEDTSSVDPDHYLEVLISWATIMINSAFFFAQLYKGHIFRVP